MATRAFSFGGGVQSMAALVLAAQGKLDYKTFLFSNVGDDSEYPETIEYFHNIAVPFAKANGLELITLKKTRRDGEERTLYQHIMKVNNSIDIPARMPNGAPGRRKCTGDYKVKVVAKWMKRQLFEDYWASLENPPKKWTREHRNKALAMPAVVGVGISLDEFQRMKDSRIPYVANDYPLVDMRITRDDCIQIIKDAGLPVPPKSSCFFCPFHHLTAWQELYDKHPDLFQKSVEIEQKFIDIRTKAGKDPVFLTGKGKPLSEVVDGSHRSMPVELKVEDDGQYNCGPFTCDGGASGGEEL